MSQKIIFLKGLPASGKSTWAIQYCKENPEFKRLNKDDLREQAGNPPWSKSFENEILSTQRNLGLSYLNDGFSIIIDDTNFSEKHWEYWSKVASERSIEIDIKVFDTPVDVCVERDKSRQKSVGEAVIRSMYKQHVKHKIVKTDSRYILEQDLSLPKCIICDIDGTLALINGRNPYDDSLIHNDRLNKPVRNILYVYKLLGYRIIILSGRTDNCKEQTLKWLISNQIFFEDLYMRKSGDFRQDAVVKKEIYEKYIKGKYYVDFVLDDRNQVVDMWREEGLLCL